MGRWDPWRGCHRCSEGFKFCYIHKGDAKRGRDTDTIVRNENFYRLIEKKKNGEYKMKPGLIFPMVYLTYAIIYGYVSGIWLYGIINIPDRGLGFVSGVVLGTALVIIGLTWFQYRIIKKKLRTDIQKSREGERQ